GIGPDRLEQTQVVGQVGPVPAESREDSLRHSVAIPDRDIPGLAYRGAGLWKQRLGDRQHASGRDAKPPGLRFSGEAREHGAVPDELGGLQLIRPADDARQWLADGDEGLPR